MIKCCINCIHNKNIRQRYGRSMCKLTPLIERSPNDKACKKWQWEKKGYKCSVCGDKTHLRVLDGGERVCKYCRRLDKIKDYEISPAKMIEWIKRVA